MSYRASSLKFEKNCRTDPTMLFYVSSSFTLEKNFSLKGKRSIKSCGICKIFPTVIKLSYNQKFNFNVGQVLQNKLFFRYFYAKRTAYLAKCTDTLTRKFGLKVTGVFDV